MPADLRLAVLSGRSLVFPNNVVLTACQLCYLMSIVRDLEPAWAHTFLRWTRMLDLNSQGDIPAVIDLQCTAHGLSPTSNYAIPSTRQVHAQV
ncbi:uncharacterized protein HD556DRAFT_1402835 [Suillus plorans]|uniref:Uncharacterized protein n=1 Tax=Suillus plorans TaxID=116603 RepID=A0A9P7AFR9_9AGAM|nr:uncharacterized protein HD556DRAFT_1402835 [Suillus plorans]KAG1788543.1 hypothetical protein HD556DRAFT_1402835 [Suillus plorans]